MRSQEGLDDLISICGIWITSGIIMIVTDCHMSSWDSTLIIPIPFRFDRAFEQDTLN